jgi:uncharacterized protein
MTIAIIIIAALVVLLAGLFGVARHAANEITRKRKATLDEIFLRVEADGLYSKERFDRLAKEDVEITGADGLKLKGYWHEPFPHANRAVVLVHGYTVAFPWMLQFVDMYVQLGFNVLLVDQRAHGRSEGTYSTYGYKEKYDVDAWVTWLRQRKGDGCVIGLHGQSLGGGTVLEYAGLVHAQDTIAFIVADCPYSDLTALIHHQIRNLNRMPTFPLLGITNLLVRLYAGFWFHDVSPIRRLPGNALPILFIHGSEDIYVPTWMSIALHKAAKTGLKKLVIVDKAVHANAYGTDKALYEREVTTFLEEALPSSLPNLSRSIPVESV